jgi:hypothetical protein
MRSLPKAMFVVGVLAFMAVHEARAQKDLEALQKVLPKPGQT